MIVFSSFPRRVASLTVVLLLLVAGLSSVQAQHFGRNKVVYDDFDFERIQTEHFDVYYYPPMAPAAQDAARMAERWYTRLSQVFQHEFTDRKPIILYADDTDFQQTNVIGGFIGEGTGGVTEGGRQRLIMPLTGAYDETDRILGHEMVHVFQYDLWKENPRSFRLGALPLWLIEGTAEYLSSGRQDPHTAMWMRDAVRNDDIPTTRQLTREQNRYFPYRYGQALMAYIGGNWGDQTLGILYRRAGYTGLETAFQEVLGLTGEELSASWAEALRSTYGPQMDVRPPPSDVGQQVLSRETTGGRMNFSPSISPDGQYVAFFSERGLFSVDLYVANAETGEIIRRLTKSGTSSHFDAVRFISSAGSWSPDGRRLAFVTFRKGNNQIAILNARTGRIEQRYQVERVGSINNPAWGPDGRRIAFSGNTGGLTNLYVLDTETGAVRQRTDDKHAALQPAWSPDGSQLAYVTDRGADTNFSRLTIGEMRIGLVGAESGAPKVLPLFDDARHINPQFSPDGQSLYFVANPDGYSDVYRYHLGDDQRFRLTSLATGVSGITSLSPALSVARQSGQLVFSVYEDNGYTIHRLDASETTGERVERSLGQARAAAQLPPPESDRPGLVGSYLADPSGLPDQAQFPSTPYRPRLLLDYIGTQGTVGVGYTSGISRFDTQVGGGIQFLWNDLMGDHTVGATVLANGTLKDIGGGAAYLNRSGRWQWGGSASHTPIQSGAWSVRREPITIGDQTVQSIRTDQILQRTFIDQGSATAAYPFNVNQRVEGSLGFTRLSYDFEVETIRTVGGQVVERTRSNPDAPAGLNLGDASAALVGDYSFFGFTSPVQGRRYRLEVGSQFGDLFYQNVFADYREYVFAPPVTLALRGMHLGRYGPDAEDPRLTPQFLGNGTLVRGYSYFTFDPDECGTNPSVGCPAFDRLVGSRTALGSAEVRVPLFGTPELGLFSFPYLPTELVAFVDGGLAWSSDDAPVFEFARTSNERIPVFSTGLSARVNVLGFAVVELMGVFPFQRPDKGWHFDFQISPGW